MFNLLIYIQIKLITNILVYCSFFPFVDKTAFFNRNQQTMQ